MVKPYRISSLNKSSVTADNGIQSDNIRYAPPISQCVKSHQFLVDHVLKSDPMICSSYSERHYLSALTTDQVFKMVISVLMLVREHIHMML